MRMIELCEIASIDNFNEDCYLIVNTDVASAGEGSPGFARQHLVNSGLAERRTQLRRSALAEVNDARAEKLNRFSVSLPQYESKFMGVGLTMALADNPELPVPYEQISAHEYREEVAEFVDSRPGHRLLDLGAGLRPTYRENVLYVDIAALPSTDVLSFADELPFESGLFDGAVCIAVLEHVPRPWLAAEELLRVVRPGGELIVDWPFLAPVHGYPHHYFNATDQGARHLFESLGAEVNAAIPIHPVFTLRWLLDEWQKGLDGPARTRFGKLTVQEILARSSVDHLSARWASSLSVNHQSVISAGTRLRLKKP